MPKLIFIHRNNDVASCIHPLHHLKAVSPIDQWLRIIDIKIIDPRLRALYPTDIKDIPKALRR